MASSPSAKLSEQQFYIVPPVCLTHAGATAIEATMSRIPNAWDDDFEALADSKNKQPPPAPRPAHAPAPKISRAVRRAQHAEANRELWNSADNPETFHYVEVTRDVPLASEPKPQLKVLSRKPKKPEPAAAGIEQGISAMAISTGEQLDDDPDSEEETRREQMRTLKERQEKARVEREEKQRRYNERREQLFGSPASTPNGPASGASSPTAQTNNGNGGGRSRPGRGGGRGGRSQGSHTPSSADQSPARVPQQSHKQLFEPGYSAKPDSIYLQRREAGRPSTPQESSIIRNPRGPDGSGRGGFGFAPRGKGKAPPK